MKILIVAAGGFGTITAHITRELAARDNEITVVAPAPPNGQRPPSRERVRLICYDAPRNDALRSLVLWITAWPEIHAADAILAMDDAHGAFLGYTASCRYNKPYVLLTDTVDSTDLIARTNLRAAFARTIHLRARCTVATHRSAADRLARLGLPESSIEVFLPDAPVHESSPDGSNAGENARRRFALDADRVILAAGRFNFEGSEAMLLEAMPRVFSAFPNTQLVLTGFGPGLQEALHKAAELDIRNQVLFPGLVPDEDFADLCEVCDLCVAASDDDGGMWNRALAHGKPVISPNSSPAGLADAILRLLKDPALARFEAEQGRKTALDMDWPRLAGLILERLALNR